jgi:hypothetical protein
VLTVVWRDLETFIPRRGDVIFLKRASVYKFDGGSLNAYEGCEIGVNLDCQELVPLREWWELRELHETGALETEIDVL